MAADAVAGRVGKTSLALQALRLGHSVSHTSLWPVLHVLPLLDMRAPLWGRGLPGQQDAVAVRWGTPSLAPRLCTCLGQEPA